MPSTQNPLADARTQLAEAIQFLGFDEGMRRMLETARKEVTVSIPLRRDDGTISGTASSTTSLEVRRREESDTPPTWTLTRSGRWPCG